ncbi:MAG: LysM peptidoglycan-binding domain-containing protein, partial [Candidatus Margulisbacteria bacterium]|nr:LysM peptidoglycan-binding domain-containing protein [Candidatus Margulisiibacteriota bacterium]
GYLFYGKGGETEAMAIQVVDLEKNMSAQEFAQAIEKQANVKPTYTASKTGGEITGWLARYDNPEESQYVTRFYWVDGTEGFILTQQTTSTMYQNNFYEALDSLRHLSAEEKAKITVKRMKVHTVKSGESIIDIAKDYGVTAEAIKDYNVLDSTNLRTGQKLKIPQS